MKLRILVLGGMLALFGVGVIPVEAAVNKDFMSAYDLPEGEMVVGSLYVTSKDVTIAGHVTGDVVVVAEGALVITGTVDGGVLGAANSVEISGTIGQSVRVLGETITISGTVAGDITTVSSALKVASNGVVEGNIYAVTEEKDIQGRVVGDTEIVGVSTAHTRSVKDIVIAILYSFLSMGLFAVILVSILPTTAFQSVVDTVNKGVFKSFGWGLLALALAPILGVLIMITGVGVWLGLALLLLFSLLYVVAIVDLAKLTGIWVFQLFRKSQTQNVLHVLVGCLLVAAANGMGLGIVSFVVFVIALGARTKTVVTAVHGR
jgi:hypothetical protein